MNKTDTKIFRRVSGFYSIFSKTTEKFSKTTFSKYYLRKNNHTGNIPFSTLYETSFNFTKFFKENDRHPFVERIKGEKPDFIDIVLYIFLKHGHCSVGKNQANF